MAFVSSVSTIDFPNKVAQQEVKDYVKDLFLQDFPQIERMLPAFDNTEIRSRNFCKPLHYYATHHNFEERNNEYINCSLEYSIKAIEESIRKAGVTRDSITDFIFISTTGLATPSLDALLINLLKLNPYINRMPIFGLGCAGGVSGFAKACNIANANSKAVVLLVSVELCSLTFMKKDISKSNFIATSLFSDGVVASIIKGDDHKPKHNIQFVASQSHLYYDSLDVMGWDFKDDGFKVIFSQNIPNIIHKNVKEDITKFLASNHLELSDIKNFIFHPGGRKVLEAYSDALQVEGDFLKNTRETMNEYGNMSSGTVLYVLNKFIEDGFEDGYGLMLALGPGFSSDMALLKMKN